MDQDENTTKLLESVRVELEKLLEQDTKANTSTRSFKTKSIERGVILSSSSSKSQPLQHQKQTKTEFILPTLPQIHGKLQSHVWNFKTTPLPQTPQFKQETKTKSELATAIKPQLKPEVKIYSQTKSERTVLNPTQTMPLTKGFQQRKLEIQPNETLKNRRDNILMRVSNNRNSRPFNNRHALLDGVEQSTTALRQDLDDSYRLMRRVGNRLEAFDFNSLRSCVRDMNLSSRMVQKKKTNVTSRPGITLEQVPELNNFYDICDQLNSVKGCKKN